MLQVHWTLEWFGGVDQILKWESVEGEHRRCDNFDERLLLTEYGLMLLKNCSLERCCKKYLMDVQNATTHVAVLDGIARLTGLVSNNLALRLPNTLDKLFLRSGYFRYLICG